MKYKRILVIVLDSVGIGELPDAIEYGDVGTHTLRSALQARPDIQLPNLSKLGLKQMTDLPFLAEVIPEVGVYGRMGEMSHGKDTLTGHWEMAGIHTKVPFRTFPDGFPGELLDQLEEQTGRAILGNIAASGTEIIEQYGAEQMKSGDFIVYTSADSVMQIAAHEEIIPLETLYEGCRIARRLTLQDPYAVARVIARPYTGTPGSFRRTANRHDYAVKPPGHTILQSLKAAGYQVSAVGKINDIFSGEGITASVSTRDNEEGIEQTLLQLQKHFEGLLFVNLVDFDVKYGHRRDPAGYAQALEAFDCRLPEIMNHLHEDDLLIITADHGNDPCHVGTDHTREYVPLLCWSKTMTEVVDVGTRLTMADIAATLADNFEVQVPPIGSSFLKKLALATKGAVK